jgi:hypothetical protein
MIRLPPDAGAAQLATSPRSVGLAVGGRGFAGLPTGTTVRLAVDLVPVPKALWAVTVKVYEVPLARPSILQVVSPVVVQVRPPGAAVTE